MSQSLTEYLLFFLQHAATLIRFSALVRRQMTDLMFYILVYATLLRFLGSPPSQSAYFLL